MPKQCTVLGQTAQLLPIKIRQRIAGISPRPRNIVNDCRIYTCLKATTGMDLGKEGIMPLVEDAVVWSNQHGLVVALKGDEFVNPDFAVIHAPLSLTPVVYPRARFKLAQQVMPLFNRLVDAVAADEDYLEGTLRHAAQYDGFTGRLLAVLHATRSTRDEMRVAGRNVVLGIHRSDYMLDQPSGKFLQVELNTIASSFGCLSALMTRLHTYMASRITSLDPARLPANPTLEHIPDAIATAATAVGLREQGGVVVMVVQPGERNAYDQQWIQLGLWERHRLRTVRMTLGDIAASAKLDETTGTVTLANGAPVCVFYFRAGYTPVDYPTEAEWAARELIERSNAAKCPTVAYQLAGTKKVQQDLAGPGVLERFLPDSRDSGLLREFFAGLWSLDPRDLTTDPGVAAAVADAVARPEAYVLKPQREGGGNNLYGRSIVELRAALAAGGEQLSAYILMQRILPPSNRSILVRNGQWSEAETLSELGIYGTFVRHGDAVLRNQQSGHLVRTKTSSSNEGGVAAGFAVLDSPYLVD
ncbi:hypothetical protein VOLCADRAFT_76898 [Volvox carteri f. nagariensis]|uniref:Glutathione synthetase n=1 Tax=Volvox carteri f. nagariensis TaxID=3068 RepID=D8UB55_VOLCA|nr:uncharacterized protein VOLCADRAFT_76898 [Volvox carteri f. nagariensis]EFJ43050.1 hypothetical protein VOLCADRAFT_76898 [Volvox carteri f. nagariensis]|eukprot:XP_002955849.1 hypothetical protein VOLCADRAFT_76898 [Volvox carteri f. nagariensis]